MSKDRVSASAAGGLNSRDIQLQAKRSSRIKRSSSSQMAACFSRLLSFPRSSPIGSTRRKFTSPSPFACLIRLNRDLTSCVCTIQGPSLGCRPGRQSRPGLDAPLFPQPVPVRPRDRHSPISPPSADVGSGLT